MATRTKQGERGEAVKAWQAFLNGKGFNVGTPDGIHGPGTEKQSLAYEASLKEAPAAVPAGRLTFTSAQKHAIDCVLAIFETGKVPTAESYSTCVLLKDGAGISYGKHQCTDKAGSLDLVVRRYIEFKGEHAAELVKYQERLTANDSAKVDPAGPYPAWLVDLIAVLKKAGRDPLMQQAQDAVFDEVYFAPAVKHANALGLKTALGLLTLYDTCIHSGPGRVATHVKLVKTATPAEGGDERVWLPEYLEVRRAWLAASTNPLVQKCVYRQDALQELVKAGNWSLAMPFVCRGRTVADRAVA